MASAPTPAPGLELVAALLGADTFTHFAEGRWELPDTPGRDEVTVWGAGPRPRRGAWSDLLVSAGRRDLALARLRWSSDWPRTVIHPLDPPGGGKRTLGAPARRWLLRGALAELRADAARMRPIDALLEAAVVVTSRPAIRVGSGGSVLVRGDRRGTPAIVRIGAPGSSSDPRPAAEALASLARVPSVPAPPLLDAGETLGFSWTVEAVMPGRPPRRLTPRIGRDLVAACEDLSNDRSPPLATEEDLAAIGRALPERSTAVDAVARHVRAVTAGWPGVMRHGDLWTGNLLVRSGRVSAIVDWDAWHPRAVPGTDLLQLVATERRLARGLALGAMWAERPWRDDDFRSLTTGYWDAVGVPFDHAVGEVVGIGWWAAEVAGTLSRGAPTSRGEAWLTANVDLVLDRLVT